jgi:hypothetical protein
MATNITQITAPRVDLIDARTGKISREWYMFFYNLYTVVGSGTGVVPVTGGGTGLSQIPTNGELLIGNGTGYTLNTLGYGAGISVTNGSGTITVANTGVLSNIAGAGISVSGTTGNVTITNTGVRSWSGGTTGLTPAAATTGTVTLAGTLVVANGGTNSTAIPTAGAIAYGSGSAYAFTSAGSSGQVLTSAGAGTPTWTTPTVGTVTSVGLSLPSQFTVTNSPVTSSGTLTGSWNNQTANYVLAGPTTGAAAAPTFRALVSGDIPSLSYVTSVTGTAPVVSSGGLTPAISMAAANTSTDGYLTSTDWNTFNSKQPAGTYVTSVAVASSNGFAGTSSGGATPTLTLTTSISGIIYGNGTALAAATISAPLGYSAGTLSITQATTSTNGYLSSTDWNTFNNKQPAGTYVTAVSVVSANGLAGTSSGGATPALTLSTTITGLLKGNGTAISAATSGTDYAPATSGTSILYGNGSGGFSNVTVGSGLSFAAGTLSSTSSGGGSAPVTQTANFTVAATDIWSINNKSGSTCTVTLPTASTNSGRVLYFQNYQVQALVSASSNVVPLTGGAAGTSILLASSGDSATLVSDGTNWLMTQYISNNNLLLE